MKYSISDEKILIYEPSLINIPKDDLRYSLIKNNEKKISEYYLFENILPKGFKVKNNIIYVKNIKIPNNIIIQYKDQLEELKNHLFDHFESFNCIENKKFLDKEGEISVDQSFQINVFRKKEYKEKKLIKKVIKKNYNILPFINEFNSDQLNIINEQLVENFDTLFSFYQFYYNGKNSKFISALKKNNLTKLERETLLKFFKEKAIKYPSKLTNFKILIKMYQNQTQYKDSYNDYDYLYPSLKRFYDKENQLVQGYTINFVKNREDLPILASIFNNCLKSKKSSFLSKNYIFFTLTKGKHYYVGQYSLQSKSIVDFEYNKVEVEKQNFTDTLKKESLKFLKAIT